MNNRPKIILTSQDLERLEALLEALPSNALPGKEALLSELERAEIVGALECVSAVALFDEDTPARIIQAVQPDILVKGADWPADQIVGRETVEARGGKVVRIAVEQGHSTTAILDRVRRPPS